MVLLQTDRAQHVPGASASEVAAYVNLAQVALQPQAPSLIALGGFSGSGKSALARTLAPHIGALPGAVLLNSDQERKVGLPQSVRLDPERYGVDEREAIYLAMFDRAKTILAAGHSVILDATFVDPRLRSAAQKTAAEAAVPFHGFWLDAPHNILAARIKARLVDASDADTAVLDAQLAADRGTITWRRIDADAKAEMVKSRAIGLLDDAVMGPVNYRAV
jgi:predicted kinase